jgi:hypothetical protein
LGVGSSASYPVAVWKTAGIWSDREEEPFQQERGRVRIMLATFLAFPVLLVVGMVLGGTLSSVLVVCAFAALAATVVLGARWNLNGSAAENFGGAKRRARADRQHRLARREQAIHDGSWQPPPS